MYVKRILKVRTLHCTAAWQTIRAESLESPLREPVEVIDEGADRREWLGYASKEDEKKAKEKFQEEKRRQGQFAIKEVKGSYQALDEAAKKNGATSQTPPIAPLDTKEDVQWKGYWADADKT